MPYGHDHWRDFFEIGIEVGRFADNFGGGMHRADVTSRQLACRIQKKLRLLKAAFIERRIFLRHREQPQAC